MSSAMGTFQNGPHASNRPSESMIHGGFGDLQSPCDLARRDIGQLRRQHSPLLVSAVPACRIEAPAQLKLCDDRAVTVDRTRIDVLEWRRRTFLRDPSMCLQHEMTRPEQKTQNRARIGMVQFRSMFPFAPASVKDRPDILKEVLGLGSIDSCGEPCSDKWCIFLVQQLE